MKIRSYALAMTAVSALSTIAPITATAADRERTVLEQGAFSAKMWTPTEPDKQGACPSFVFRLDNRLQRRVHFDKADLRVYWVSNDRLQSINGFRPKDPRRIINLLDEDERLKSTNVLSRQVINVCDAWPGSNRITMALHYATHSGNTGTFKMTSSFCVRSATESCAEITSVPDVESVDPEVEVVDHSQYPQSRFPIEFLHGRTANTVTESECPAPSYTIAPNDGLVACVDSSAFPEGTLVAIEKSIGCPAGTTRTAGGTDTFRELCVRDDHALGLQWQLGFRLPRSIRSTPGGSDGFMPVEKPIYSPWYLNVNSREPAPAIRYERVDDDGTTQYTTRVAGSAGKLPDMQDGVWHVSSDARFLADAWDSDNDMAPVYCGYAPTIALCSLTRSDLNSFPHVVESMYLQRTAGADTTPVYLYGNSNIVTQAMIDAGTVDATLLTLSRTLLGHTSRN